METKNKEHFKSQLTDVMTICSRIIEELNNIPTVDDMPLSADDYSMRVDDLLDDSAFDLLAAAQAKRLSKYK